MISHFSKRLSGSDQTELPESDFTYCDPMLFDPAITGIKPQRIFSFERRTGQYYLWTLSFVDRRDRTLHKYYSGSYVDFSRGQVQNQLALAIEGTGSQVNSGIVARGFRSSLAIYYFFKPQDKKKGEQVDASFDEWLSASRDLGKEAIPYTYSGNGVSLVDVVLGRDHYVQELVGRNVLDFMDVLPPLDDEGYREIQKRSNVALDLDRICRM